MATRSTISVVQDNGSVISIYCHWDGDLSGVGKTLIEHYNTKEKANELVALGSLSSLGRYPKPIDETLPRHTFENAHKDVTVAYHRDRDEDLDQTVFDSVLEYRGHQSYNYIFKDGKWYVAQGGKFLLLTPEFIKEGEKIYDAINDFNSINEFNSHKTPKQRLIEKYEGIVQGLEYAIGELKGEISTYIKVIADLKNESI